MCMISVVTSVYNCEKFIEETIKGVQKQTYENWEYILIDDCSKDDSAAIIERMAAEDPRIRFIRNESNKGQVKNLNEGIAQAKGKYIARLDHDDLIHPDRFAMQLAYMESHPQTVLLGSWMDRWLNGKVFTRKFDNFAIKSAAEVKLLIIATNIMPHSSFFIRKAAMVDNNIWYDERFKYAEDYALVADMSKAGELFVLDHKYVTYRQFEEQFTKQCSENLIEGEGQDVQISLADRIEEQTSLKTDIYRKAIRGELAVNSEYKQLKEFVIDYAKICGIGEREKDIVQNRNVQLTYLLLCARQQKIDMRTFFFYAINNLRYRGWMFDRRGLSFLKHCLIGNKK